MDNDPISQKRVDHGGSGPYGGVTADPHIRSHSGVRTDDRAGADLRARTDHGTRIDLNALLQPRLRMYVCTGCHTLGAEDRGGPRCLGYALGLRRPA